MTQRGCPKCKGDMLAVIRSEVPATACEDCDGIWVDIAVLEALPEKVPAAVELTRIYSEVTSQALTAADHSCSVCSQTLLLGESNGVKLEMCNGCKGIYLDRAELAGVLDPKPTQPCPKCTAPMHSTESEDVPSMSCRNCGGCWLDMALLTHLTNAGATAKLTQESMVRAFTMVTLGETTETKYGCPDCSKPLRACKHEGIELDFCFDCSGLYLDRGEVDNLIALNASPAERATAALASGSAKALNGLLSAIGDILTR